MVQLRPAPESVENEARVLQLRLLLLQYLLLLVLLVLLLLLLLLLLLMLLFLLLWLMLPVIVLWFCAHNPKCFAYTHGLIYSFIYSFTLVSSRARKDVSFFSVFFRSFPIFLCLVSSRFRLFQCVGDCYCCCRCLSRNAIVKEPR